MGKIYLPDSPSIVSSQILYISTQIELLALVKTHPSFPSCMYMFIEYLLYFHSPSDEILPILQCPDQSGASSMKPCLIYSNRSGI